MLYEKNPLFRMAVLMAAMMCALGASAQEAYACYTWENATFTFYYGNERSSRPDITYGLNENEPGDVPEWYYDLIDVTKVVFDPSFANYRPTSTYGWFSDMGYLESILGMKYLNTSEVTDMRLMFDGCRSLSSIDLSGFNKANVDNMWSMFSECNNLTRLDLSTFNTAKVRDFGDMFQNCYKLQTIYVGDGWILGDMDQELSGNMFNGCFSLVSGKGTTFDPDHVDADYAHIDGGPSNPGYFSEKSAFIRGDVNGDVVVNIADVTVLIDLLLGGGAISNPAADCNQDGNVNIADVTALIDYLLSGTWPSPPLTRKRDLHGQRRVVHDDRRAGWHFHDGRDARARRRGTRLGEACPSGDALKLQHRSDRGDPRTVAGCDGLEPERFYRESAASRGACFLGRLPDFHQCFKPIDRQDLPTAHRGRMGVRRPWRKHEQGLHVCWQQRA